MSITLLFLFYIIVICISNKLITIQQLLINILINDLYSLCIIIIVNNFSFISIQTVLYIYYSFNNKSFFYESSYFFIIIAISYYHIN